MKNFWNIVGVIMVAAIYIGVTSMPAEAGSNTRKRNRAIAAGVVTGIIVGGAIANANRQRYDDDDDYDDDDEDIIIERRRPRRERRARRASSGHVARCYAAYKSYDERTDTYVSYSGEVRRCRK